MILDVVVFGIPVLLGLFVMWRGVRRSLLALPVRILIALLAAWLVSSAASAYLVVEPQLFFDAIGQRLGVPTPFVLSAIGSIIFLLVLLAVRRPVHAMAMIDEKIAPITKVMRREAIVRTRESTI